ncbi:STAS domain-containing protein [Sphingopyxis sp. XHP0097]|uniref:STAS domain-containing protein n=1 Tax=Sphingopyxis jiangsuensis TaxID=2871171 RepID=A0ABS7MB99_9SPHN|nr:STAS domain-containing protein [Sphingopyxis jiangsuensis]
MSARSLTPKLLSVWREGYSFATFRADALAGLTVAIVALPLAMALGIASGASPDRGLVTAVVAGFLISALGGSRVQIGGPTGAFVVVVFNVIAAHGYDGLLIATLLAGLILIAAGALGLGQMIKYVPHPVVTGFTAGIAVIIASSQVKDFLGLSVAEVPADFLARWRTLLEALDTFDPVTLAVGIAALTIIVGLRRLAPRFPAFLIAIVATSAAVAHFRLPVDTVGTSFPGITAGLPVPSIPDLSLMRISALLPSAFTIAFLAGIEALLSAVVADGMAGTRHRPNQELVGQGVANLGSALFGGLPATGAIARTATNIRSGARTPVAGIVHAMAILSFILFAGHLMSFVPMASLAAVLFIVAWGMSEHRRFLLLLRMPNSDRAVLLLTFILTISVDLTVAIAVGVTLASLLFMARMAEAVEVGRGMPTESGRDAEDIDQRDDLPPGVEVFRIAGPFFFGVAGELLDTLRRLGEAPRVIILRMRLVPLLDASGAQAIADFVDQASAAGAYVILSGVQSQPAAILARMRLGEGASRLFYASDYKSAQALGIELAEIAEI